MKLIDRIRGNDWATASSRIASTFSGATEKTVCDIAEYLYRHADRPDESADWKPKRMGQKWRKTYDYTKDPKVAVPLSVEMIRECLLGERQVIGSYFVALGTRLVHKGVVDLDSHDHPHDVDGRLQLLCDRLDQLGIGHWVELSRGGKGFHIVIPCAAPVEARLIRAVVRKILADLEIPDLTKNGVEFFPKSDEDSSAGSQTTLPGSAIWIQKTGGTAVIDRRTKQLIPMTHWLEVFESASTLTVDGLKTLAVAVGADIAEKPKAGPRKAAVSRSVYDAFARIDRQTSGARQAAAWMAKRDPAVHGDGGDAHTFKTAAKLLDFVEDDKLSEDEAWSHFVHWNESCDPPWTDKGLKEKWEAARKYRKKYTTDVPRARREPPVVADLVLISRCEKCHRKHEFEAPCQVIPEPEPQDTEEETQGDEGPHEAGCECEECWTPTGAAQEPTQPGCVRESEVTREPGDDDPEDWREPAPAKGKTTEKRKYEFDHFIAQGVRSLIEATARDQSLWEIYAGYTKEDEDKAFNACYRALMHRLDCRTKKRKRKCDDSHEHVRTFACDRTGSCRLCAEMWIKYAIPYCIEHWRGDRFTIMEQRLPDNSTLPTAGAVLNMKRALTSYVPKSSKLPYATSSGHRGAVLVSSEALYHRVKSAHKVETVGAEDEFVIDDMRVAILSKKDAAQLFWDCYREPAVVFNAIIDRVTRLYKGGRTEAAREAIIKDLLRQPYVVKWHAQRIARNGPGQEWFPRPDKETIRKLARANRVVEHPELKAAVLGCCDHCGPDGKLCGKRLNGGELFVGKLRLGSLPDGLTEEASSRLAQRAFKAYEVTAYDSGRSESMEAIVERAKGPHEVVGTKVSFEPVFTALLEP